MEEGEGELGRGRVRESEIKKIKRMGEGEGEWERRRIKKNLNGRRRRRVREKENNNKKQTGKGDGQCVSRRRKNFLVAWAFINHSATWNGGKSGRKKKMSKLHWNTSRPMALYLGKKILLIDFFLVAYVVEHHLRIPEMYHTPESDF
jgi:hypothetical protein